MQTDRTDTNSNFLSLSSLIIATRPEHKADLVLCFISVLAQSEAVVGFRITVAERSMDSSEKHNVLTMPGPAGFLINFKYISRTV